MPNTIESLVGDTFHLGNGLDQSMNNSNEHIQHKDTAQCVKELDADNDFGSTNSLPSLTTSPSSNSTNSSNDDVPDLELSSVLPQNATGETVPQIIHHRNEQPGQADVVLQETTGFEDEQPDTVGDGASQPPQTVAVSNGDPRPVPATQARAEEKDEKPRLPPINWGAHVVEFTPGMLSRAGDDTEESDTDEYELLSDMDSEAMDYDSTCTDSQGEGEPGLPWTLKARQVLASPQTQIPIIPGALWNNEYFAIMKSPLGGYGAFAVKDLEEGDIILVEKPIIRTNRVGFLNAVDRLDLHDKILFTSLAQFPPDATSGIRLEERVRNANAFEVPDGVAIFSVGSRFNHACEPVRNVLYSHEKLSGDNVIVFSVVQPSVKKGAELTIKYGSNPAVLMQNFGFRCQCGGCQEPLSDRDAESISKKWAWNRAWGW